MDIKTTLKIIVICIIYFVVSTLLFGQEKPKTQQQPQTEQQKKEVELQRLKQIKQAYQKQNQQLDSIRRDTTKYKKK